MSVPDNQQEVPAPHRDWVGSNQIEAQAKRSLAKIAALWRPARTMLEPAVSTLSRYAHRLIDRRDGKAYSADELETKILAQFAATSTAWGDISGTLASQSDLQSALDAKLSSATAASTYATSSNLASHTGNTSNPHGVTKSQVGLGNVENTALSTWTGATTITVVGTIATGTWNATTISLAKGGTGGTDMASANVGLGVYRASKNSTTNRSSANTGTTLTDDHHLVISETLPVGLYQVEIMLSTYADNSVGFKWALASSGTITTGSTNRGQWIIGTEAASGLKTVASWPSGTGTNTWGSTYSHLIRGLLNITAPGDLRFQWAQNTSSASSTGLYEGYMIARKVN